MSCTERLNDGPLVCIGEAGHDYGCVFESTSAVDDRHSEGGHG